MPITVTCSSFLWIQIIIAITSIITSIITTIIFASIINTINYDYNIIISIKHQFSNLWYFCKTIFVNTCILALTLPPLPSQTETNTNPPQLPPSPPPTLCWVLSARLASVFCSCLYSREYVRSRSTSIREDCSCCRYIYMNNYLLSLLDYRY